MRLAPVARAAALVVCLALVGCSSNNTGKIEGTKWRSVAQQVKGQMFAEGAFELEFKKDGGLTYKAPAGTLTGKYSLGSADRVTFHLDQPLGGNKKHIESITINANELQMT